jgi:hypothetical protein
MKRSAPVTLETVITHAPGVFRGKLDGTLLLAARRGGQGHCMDPVGVAIWENLAAPCPINSLCDLLCARYEVDRVECERDVMEFVIDLLDREMVVIAESAT